MIMKRSFRGSPVLVLVTCTLLIPASAFAQCDEPDAPDCVCFVDGGEWDPGGPAVYPFTVFIQDVAEESLPPGPGTDGVEESCACNALWGCDWDTDPADPDDNFENGGKPYWQMVLGANSEDLALWWAELLADESVTMSLTHREAWCSETVSYWHRESAIPYLRGYLSDWWPHWRISNVGDLKAWYEAAEDAGGRGRWIEATEVDYGDFELGVNAPVPGAYIALAEYDDVADEYPDLVWSHSVIVDEMTVHRDGHGDVFQVEIDLLEGNSGNRVRDDHHWDDLLTITPQGSGWEAWWPGADGIMGTPDDIRRKVYGIGIDLDTYGQPYYDPARLHEVDHPGMLRAVLPSPVIPGDDAWDDYAVFLPSLIAYAKIAIQEGAGHLKSGLIPGGFQPLPDGTPQHELYIPEEFVGTITVQFPAPHPMAIEGLELTWGEGAVPSGYGVTFYDDSQQGVVATVPDLGNHIPPAGLPAMVPVVLDTAMTNVVAVQLFFPADSVPPDTVLSDVMVRFEGAPWEDVSTGADDTQRAVFVDIKPGSCPNAFNPTKKGVLPVAIVGTFGLDVTDIDPASVMAAGSVAPSRWAYEDVATPYVGGAGGCTTLEADGILDLTLKYDALEVAGALDLASHGGEMVPLSFHGTLEISGTAVHGEDWLRVLDK
jgi:hypothetical protein